MKIPILTVFVLFSHFVAFTQVQVIEYYNEEGHVVEKEKSFYYEVGVKIPRLIDVLKKNVEVSPAAIKYNYQYIDTVKTYYVATNSLRSLVIFEENGMRQGVYYEFHPNGKLREKAFFLNNVRAQTSSAYYESGKPHYVIRYSTDANSGFNIISYWNPIGIKFVSEGNGLCDCILKAGIEHGLNEKGKVVDGLKDSIWFGFIHDTLSFKETYSKGKFIEGKRFLNQTEVPYKSLEEAPTYKGGLNALAKFLQKNMHYPSDARRGGIEGKVFISFVIDKDGTPGDFEIAKGVHAILDNEALRVLKLMPGWNPGQQRGVAVKVRYILPVNFDL